MMTSDGLTRLRGIIEQLRPLAVAVSGGVDSMTLSVVAHDVVGDAAQMFHAVSAAVPPDATERVRRYARARGWRLQVIDAGEFGDPRYLANPANRCYFCKTNLYDAIAPRVDATLVSGTNVDDLGDYRPGLTAAAEHGVRHPYVESGIDKAGVRAIARALGLDDLVELPAAPCLSSRLETGIRVDADTLAAVYRVERLVASALVAETVRCRVRRNAVVIELDADALEHLSEADRESLTRDAAACFARIGIDRPIAFEHYRMGSAFLR